VPRRVDHEERRRELVDAALRVVVRDGLEAATVRNIAQEAGCSVRPVQYYFADKATLLAAAHARVTERLGALVATSIAALGPSPAPRDVARAVARSFLPLDDERRGGMIAYYAFPSMTRRVGSRVLQQPHSQGAIRLSLRSSSPRWSASRSTTATSSRSVRRGHCPSRTETG
jgi:AcrR family transcriptional regulator